jgi:hypothetical protein
VDAYMGDGAHVVRHSTMLSLALIPSSRQ